MHPHQFEQGASGVCQTRQLNFSLATTGMGLPQARYESTQPGAINKFDPGQVEYQFRILRKQRLDRIFEGARCTRIQNF